MKKVTNMAKILPDASQKICFPLETVVLLFIKIACKISDHTIFDAAKLINSLRDRSKNELIGAKSIGSSNFSRFAL